jgi:hypothetical protein
MHWHTQHVHVWGRAAPASACVQEPPAAVHCHWAVKLSLISVLSLESLPVSHITEQARRVPWVLITVAIADVCSHIRYVSS